MPQSAILYYNPEETVFLIDIPTSIALAQELSLNQRSASPGSQQCAEPRRKQIFSSIPRAEPFSPSTEPKTDAARAKVLERIPRSERVFHAEIIEPLVRDGLESIKQGVLERRIHWCHARKVLDEALSSETRLGKRRRASSNGAATSASIDDCSDAGTQELDGDSQPPLILSSSGTNAFASESELRGIAVKNTSSGAADLSVRRLGGEEKDIISHTAENDPQRQNQYHEFTVPPLSGFVLCRLPIAQYLHQLPTAPVPSIPRDRKFNLILLDPPWTNRSVRRGGHYHTQHYTEGGELTQYIRSVLQAHLYDPSAGNNKTKNPRFSTRSVAAIWITNSSKARRTAYGALRGAGLSVCEEWVWIKVTTSGEPVTPVDGVWRKPYEILIIGENMGENQRRDPVRRVIAAVPDVHSRKPNLKEIFERLFFSCPGHTYAALEVFARNLTAGWWVCGDEVLKFNAQEWWTEQSTS
ncbi:MT-A70 family [Aspergillus affinis]|uniref:MT-A70 family n=1 Tax=Aspergillus affinis TaxID=1070780 RepID=UPI0022FECB83|nr:MT-A70 family [Aspergillus affinis]KAI9045059.1 MT-A70 family [Aspergillus affinis]